jgi:hypothetical protein
MLQILVSELKREIKRGLAEDVLVDTYPLSAAGYSIQIRKDYAKWVASNYKFVNELVVILEHDGSDVMIATVKKGKVINVATNLITSSRFNTFNSYGENDFIQALSSFDYMLRSAMVDTLDLDVEVEVK